MADQAVALDAYAVGDTVRAHGIKALPEINGQCGKVIQLLHGTGRYRVEFDEPFGKRALKPGNLETVESTAPRTAPAPPAAAAPTASAPTATATPAKVATAPAAAAAPTGAKVTAKATKIAIEEVSDSDEDEERTDEESGAGGDAAPADDDAASPPTLRPGVAVHVNADAEALGAACRKHPYLPLWSAAKARHSGAAATVMTVETPDPDHDTIVEVKFAKGEKCWFPAGAVVVDTPVAATADATATPSAAGAGDAAKTGKKKKKKKGSSGSSCGGSPAISSVPVPSGFVCPVKVLCDPVEVKTPGGMQRVDSALDPTRHVSFNEVSVDVKTYDPSTKTTAEEREALRQREREAAEATALLQKRRKGVLAVEEDQTAARGAIEKEEQKRRKGIKGAATNSKLEIEIALQHRAIEEQVDLAASEDLTRLTLSDEERMEFATYIVDAFRTGAADAKRAAAARDARTRISQEMAEREAARKAEAAAAEAKAAAEALAKKQVAEKKARQEAEEKAKKEADARAKREAEAAAAAAEKARKEAEEQEQARKAAEAEAEAGGDEESSPKFVSPGDIFAAMGWRYNDNTGESVSPTVDPEAASAKRKKILIQEEDDAADAAAHTTPEQRASAPPAALEASTPELPPPALARVEVTSDTQEAQLRPKDLLLEALAEADTRSRDGGPQAGAMSDEVRGTINSLIASNKRLANEIVHMKKDAAQREEDLVRMKEQRKALEDEYKTLIDKTKATMTPAKGKPTPVPAGSLVDSDWKRKYELLHAQLTRGYDAMKELEEKNKALTVQNMLLVNKMGDAAAASTTTTTTTTAGGKKANGAAVAAGGKGKDPLAAAKKQANKEIDTLEKAVREWKAKHAAAEADLGRAKNRAEALEADVARAKKAHQNAQTSWEGEKRKLTEKVKNVQAAMQHGANGGVKNAGKGALSNKAAAAADELARAVKDVDNLQREVVVKEKLVRLFEAHDAKAYKAAVAMVGDAKAQPMPAPTGDVPTMEEVDRLRRELADTKGRLAAATAAADATVGVASIKEELAVAAAENAQLKAAQAAAAHTATADAAALQKDLDAARKENKKLADQCKAAAQKVEALAKKEKELEKEKAKAKAAAAKPAADGDLEKLTAELEKERKQTSDLKRLNTMFVERLKGEGKAVPALDTKQDAKLENMRKELEQVSEKLKRIRDERDRYQNDYKKEKEKNKELRAALPPAGKKR